MEGTDNEQHPAVAFWSSLMSLRQAGHDYPSRDPEDGLFLVVTAPRNTSPCQGCLSHSPSSCPAGRVPQAGPNSHPKAEKQMLCAEDIPALLAGAPQAWRDLDPLQYHFSSVKSITSHHRCYTGDSEAPRVWKMRMVDKTPKPFPEPHPG